MSVSGYDGVVANIGTKRPRQRRTYEYPSGADGMMKHSYSSDRNTRIGVDGSFAARIAARIFAPTRTFGVGSTCTPRAKPPA